MNELVASNACNSGKKGHCKSEADVVCVCFWFFNIEHISLWINIITHYNKCPNPYQSLKDNYELKWDVKPFVFCEENLGFCGNVFVVANAEVVLNWRNQIDEENWDVKIVRGYDDDYTD